MGGRDVHHVVAVQSGSIGTPREMELLVVGGAGQRRQDEELEEVDRQLALDDADVALDRLRRVAREAEDVAGVRERPDRGATPAASPGTR